MAQRRIRKKYKGLNPPKKGEVRNPGGRPTNKEITQRKRRLLRELRKNMGLVYVSCEKAGIPVPTYYRWMDHDENFRKSVCEIKEYRKDFAEASLFRQINEGNTRATTFFLTTQAQDRGFLSVTRIEQTNGVGAGVNDEVLSLEDIRESYDEALVERTLKNAKR